MVNKDEMQFGEMSGIQNSSANHCSFSLCSLLILFAIFDEAFFKICLCAMAEKLRYVTHILFSVTINSRNCCVWIRDQHC